jgi:NAD(P)H-flavin reductase
MINPYKAEVATLVRNNFESDDRAIKTIYLEFENGKKMEYIPGQFCELSVFGKGEAPFGIASSPTEEGKVLEFTANRAGLVTKALHETEIGEEIGIRGPLGNGFPISKFTHHNLVIIGGGFAFTTLRSLLVFALHNRSDFGNIDVIYGAREPGLLIYKNEFKKWRERGDVNIYLTVDKEFPGWKGRVGFVPQVVGEIAPSEKDAYAVICGPPVMINFTLPVMLKLGFARDKIYTSLEKRMKCGIGKCGRCNIWSKYVCKDGPVFSFAEIEELPEEH